MCYEMASGETNNYRRPKMRYLSKISCLQDEVGLRDNGDMAEMD